MRWYPFEALFEKDYNVVTFDLRGHGLSVRPPRAGYAMEEFVEDMRALQASLLEDVVMTCVGLPVLGGIGGSGQEQGRRRRGQRH